MSVLLSIEDVSKTFFLDKQEVLAVKNISLDVKEGECLAIVGESGSGKSTLANMVLGIHPPSEGKIAYKGTLLPQRRRLEHRRAIQLVQQNPLSSFNPRRKIGVSIRLALDVHHIGDIKRRNEMVCDLLEEVGLPREFVDRRPDSLSGGQRQRLAIARAIACQSDLVVLDEPTSALDVLVQARILRLLQELKRVRNLTYIFISHDLAVVRNIADRVAVFEKGKLRELAKTSTLFTHPSTDYTKNLISAVPVVDEEELKFRNQLVGGICV